MTVPRSVTGRRMSTPRRWGYAAAAGALALSLLLTLTAVTKRHVAGELGALLAGSGCQFDRVSADLGALDVVQGLPQQRLNEVDVAVDGLEVRGVPADVGARVDNLDLSERSAESAGFWARFDWTDMTDVLDASLAASALGAGAHVLSAVDHDVTVAAEMSTPLGPTPAEVTFVLGVEENAVVATPHEVVVAGLPLSNSLTGGLPPIRYDLDLPEGVTLVDLETDDRGARVSGTATTPNGATFRTELRDQVCRTGAPSKVTSQPKRSPGGQV